MSRKHIEKHTKKLEKINMYKTMRLYITIGSTIIWDKDYREIFDNAVQFAYGNPFDEYSEKSINAIMVNDIRHNCSNYDYNLKEIYKIHRTDNDYIQYKNSVLEKIANVYPSLRDECDRQKRKCDMVKVIQR